MAERAFEAVLAELERLRDEQFEQAALPLQRGRAEGLNAAIALFHDSAERVLCEFERLEAEAERQAVTMGPAGDAASERAQAYRNAALDLREASSTLKPTGGW